MLSQREPMRSVGVDCEHECEVVATFEEPDRYLLFPAQLRGPEAMHAVDDPHCAPLHNDRR
jgi:hypothetical protein